MTPSDDAVHSLLRRLLQWDHLDSAYDGPYWRREIEAALAAHQSNAAAQEPVAWIDPSRLSEIRENKIGALAYQCWLAVGAADPLSNRTVALFSVTHGEASNVDR